MLNHIMKTASENATKQFGVLDKVSQNIANLNTPGFKAERFEQYLRPDGQIEGVSRSDYAQGDRMITRRPLDVAVQGFGFIPVTQPDGTTAYTRDGSFSLNSEGYIVTNRGDMVGSGIQVPVDYQDIKIYEDGVVKVKITEQAAEQQVGKVDLVKFMNPEGLTHIGYNKVLASGDSGEALSDGDSKLKQGMLERSNVNVFVQVDQILRLNASILSNINVIRFADDVFRSAVNLRQ